MEWKSEVSSNVFLDVHVHLSVCVKLGLKETSTNKYKSKYI